MKDERERRREVDRFILEEIDTVPHLEALLLLWGSRPKLWALDELRAALYVSNSEARAIVQSLSRRRLCAIQRESAELWRYDGVSGERDELMQAVEETYRRELIRISRMIHAKAAPGVREFAEAFRFKKDRE